MIATYRVQLTPEFDFDELRSRLPYLRRLGVSHLYLSPITAAVPGSAHGYDVIDHNEIRLDFGGREGFERLRQDAVSNGLSLIIDIVPNHAGVGPHNEAWQDMLAYGPHSPYSDRFDVDWRPQKRELHGKLLLPFLGRPYGEALDEGELQLTWEEGCFYAAYYEDRFRLSPASYPAILAAVLPSLERREGYFDLHEVQELYSQLSADERDRAEALRGRLVDALAGLDLDSALAEFRGKRLHDLLERQFWRLSYWKTAGDEVNYRRFFDVNGLVALRMEEPAVFWQSHELVSELLREEGVDGVRVDHVDGLVDPHSYLDRLAELGGDRLWVEKILAPGETLPEAWPVSGTTGYEFLNDVVRLFVHPGSEESLRRTYREFVGEHRSWREVVLRSKRLVMQTTLAGELGRLAGNLHRLSEGDYHTRDFTLNALRLALLDIIAALPRYRTYLPYETEEAGEVLRLAVSEASRRAQNTDRTVHEFIYRCLTEEMHVGLEPLRRSFVGRFQQYTAPVAAKGVEDTAFYRFIPLVALNEVGGEPDHFTIETQAFHARARFRQHRYPQNLLATATHDHKRGEDTRMRLTALSELHREWAEVASRLNERSQRFWRERGPLGARRTSQGDAYLFFQHLVALWGSDDRERLAERLRQYALKALREAKQQTSWIDPDEDYEAAMEEFVTAMVADEEVAQVVAPLAQKLSRLGFLNGLSQLVLKLTTPGVPDIYNGSELLDLSLVDPDNRAPVDYDLRERLLAEVTGERDAGVLQDWRNRCDPRLKLALLARLLNFRAGNPSPFSGEYRALEVETSDRDGSDEQPMAPAVAFARESGGEGDLVVVVPRFWSAFEGNGNSNDFAGTSTGASVDESAQAGVGDADGASGGGHVVLLPDELTGTEWQDVFTGGSMRLQARQPLSELPFLPSVLYRPGTEGTR